MKEDKNESNKVDTGEQQIKPFSMIPGPWPSLPFIGTGWYNLYCSLIGRYDLNKLHEIYIEKYRTYGPIFREEYQRHRPIVHIFDPADFETVFKYQGRCPIRPPSEFVSCFRRSRPDRYPNVGLANLNGDEWLDQRNKLAPAIMKLSTINENMLNQNEICNDFIEYLSNIKDPVTNVVDNIQEATYRLALESICMLCIDTRIGAFQTTTTTKQQQQLPETTPSDAEILIESTKLLFDTFNKLYYGYPWWKLMKTSVYSDLERAESMIYDVASKHVQKAIDDQLNEISDRQTVLQTLLKTEQLSNEEIKLTIIDFIIGGIFTVSNTFAYLFYHLASNQPVQDKLYTEIQSVKDDNAFTDDFTPKHLAKMPYLKACVQECFRLNCPVPGIMRITIKPTILSGYEIPANTIVFSHLMATCRLPDYFQNPDQFLPERWLDPIEKSTIHPFSLLPFGYGNRMCLGKRFSESELYLSLARLIQAFQLNLIDSHEQQQQQLELKHAFIVIPAHPISLQLTPR